MDGRRDLTFDRLDEVMPEVDRLLAGHQTAGRWSLGQILHHLAGTVGATARGDRPAVPPADAEAARVFEVRRRRFFRAGRFPEGVEVPSPAFIPPPDADETAGAKALRSALGRFAGSEGPFPAHPLLGPLSKDEWDAFHRLHCAHHLRFARLTSTDPGPTISPPEGGLA